MLATRDFHEAAMLFLLGARTNSVLNQTFPVFRKVCSAIGVPNNLASVHPHIAAGGTDAHLIRRYALDCEIPRFFQRR
jgi:hypothetical protein